MHACSLVLQPPTPTILGAFGSLKRGEGGADDGATYHACAALGLADYRPYYSLKEAQQTHSMMSRFSRQY